MLTSKPNLHGIIRYAQHYLRQRYCPFIRNISHSSATLTQKKKICPRSSAIYRPNSQMIASVHLSSSAPSSAAGDEVTFETILSDENKCRCQSHIQKVKPVRNFSFSKKLGNIEKAAVLVLLCLVEGKPSILFTERSNQLYMHRGEISFPGGKADDTDLHLSHTALREAEEEIGLCKEKVDVWGEMLPIPGRTFNIAVTPVVACYSGELDLASLKLNRHEVESVFAPSIEDLCHPNHNHYTCFRVQEMMTKETLKKYQDFSVKDMFMLPVYTVGGRRIWGLSAIMLHQVLRLVAGRLYTTGIGPLNWHPPEFMNM